MGSLLHGMPHIRNPPEPVIATLRPRAGIAWRRTELLSVSVMASCLESLEMPWRWVIGLWAMDFCMMKNGVLIFDFALRKKSIGEVFKSHVDFIALNPIRPFEEFMAEFTALPVFFLCCWRRWLSFRILCMPAACMVCYNDKYLSCLPLVLTLSQLPSILVRIRACNNDILARWLKCSLGFR